MRKKLTKVIVLLIAVAICLVSIAGCKPKPVQLTDTDNGKDISLKVGDRLVITLPGNPSTGYSWEVNTVDVAVLSQVGDPQFVSDNTGLVGAGGKLALTFDAEKGGITSLVLVYHRPWETDVAPLQTFKIQVTVK